MVKLIPYRTGLSTNYNKKKIPKLPFKGKSWKINLEKTEKEMGSYHEIDMDGKEIKLSYGEVIIYAKSFEKAWLIAELVKDCLKITDPDMVSITKEFEIYGIKKSRIKVLPKRKSDFKKLLKEMNMYDSKDKLEKISLTKTHSQSIIPACILAIKCSFRKNYQYAIMKLAYSIDNLRLINMDLIPNPSEEILPKIQSPKLQVRAALALFIAYSAIEELGLEVRASQKNPSRSGGSWNPSVKIELETRLKKAGINLSEKVNWMLRGGKTLLEIGRPIKGKKSDWNFGKYHDEDVEIIDALADSSWLRSYVVTHKFNELIKKISPYDVINVQELVRRLIYDKFDLWEYI